MAQTKPKAGQFYGVSNNGTDGEFLQTDGVGGMAWAATITNPTITSIDYSGSSTAADPAGGETVLIVGTGFLNGATVLIGSVAAPSVTVTSATVLTITTPAGTAGTHSVTVTNTDGGTVTQSAFFQYDGVPTWTTAAGSLGSVTEGTAASFQVTATEGSDTIEYAVTTGSLPVGLSLATATGAITGTAPAVSGATTTTFSITATDDENQTSASRSFSIIVSPVCTTNTVQIFGMDTVNEVTPSGFTGGVALYQLNGNADDVSGNYNGTATSVTYGSGITGQAGVFNGSSSRVSIPNIVNQAADHSVSLWINPTNFSSNRAAFSMFNGSHCVVFITTDGGCNTDGAASAAGSTAGTLTANAWNNIIITYNYSTTTYTMYINGVNKGTSSNFSYSGRPNSIGCHNNGSAFISYFNGNIDQVRLFSTAISAANVTTLYNEGAALALYQLNWDGSDLGNNYNGTPTNVTFSAGKFNNAGSFNGSSSYVSINSSSALLLLGDYTVSFWFKTNSVSGTQRLVNKDNANDYSGGWGFSLYSDGTFNWSHNDGSNNQNWNINAGTISANTWYNVCAVYSDSSNLRTFYLNSSSVNTIATNTNVAASTDNLFFGTYGASSALGQYLNGSLDQVRIFSKALDSTEVTTLYNEVLCTPQCTTNTTNYPTGVTNTAYYKLDGNANDVTTVYNGTASNVTWTNQGRFGNAGSFSGGSSYVNLNSVILPADIWSVSLWVNINSLVNNWLFSQYTGGAAGRFVFNITSTGGFQINVSSINSLATTDISAITVGNWHHVVVVKNGSSGWTIYADGLYHSAWSNTDNILTNQNTIIGGDDAVTGSNIIGKLDQVRIFSSALTQANVTDLYNEVAC